MKILKKITLSVILASAVFANQNNDMPLDNEKIINAYKLGAFHIISELDRNIGQQGYDEKAVKLKKYIVVKKLDDSYSTVDLLLLQRMAYSEGLTPMFVKKYFVFDSFDRKADAEYLLNGILKKSYFSKEHASLQIVDNSTNEDYYKQAFLYKKMYDKLLNEIKNKYEGKVVVVEKTPRQEIITSPIIEIKESEVKVVPTVKMVEKKEHEATKKQEVKEQKPKEVKQVTVTRHFRFKNNLKEVVFYKYSRGITNYKEEYKISAMQSEKTVQNKNQKYKFQNIVNTDVGNQFVKVLNELYFVDINDVEIID